MKAPAFKICICMFLFGKEKTNKEMRGLGGAGVCSETCMSPLNNVFVMELILIPDSVCALILNKN